MRNNNRHFDMSDKYFSSKPIDGKPSKYPTDSKFGTIKSWEQNPKNADPSPRGISGNKIQKQKWEQ